MLSAEDRRRQKARDRLLELVKDDTAMFWVWPRLTGQFDTPELEQMIEETLQWVEEFEEKRRSQGG
jgi:hypothetical protein